MSTAVRRAMELQAQQEIGIVPDSRTVFGRQASKFDDLVLDQLAIDQAIAKLELEKKAIQEQLKEYFADSDAKTVLVGGNRVTYVQNPGQSRIDKVALLEHGVPATTIAECTVPGKPYQFVKVTAPK